MGPLGLATRASVAACSSKTPARVRLGGITVYAATERGLQDGLKLLAEATVEQSRILASLDRKVLRKLVCDTLGERVDDRLFGAVLGSQMRLGLIEAVGCAAISGKMFRVLINVDLLEVFQQRLLEVREKLRKCRIVTVGDVRNHYFPGREWGTWSAANHLLARLAQMGCAAYVDSHTFAWPRGIENAFG